jgi:hypothetical protein
MFLSQRSATDTSSNNNGIDGSNSSHSGNTTGMGRNNTGDHGGTSPVGGIAHAVAAAHHAGFQRQDQPEMWVNVASDGAPHQGHHSQQQHHAHHHGSSHHHLQGPSNNNNGINGNENDHFEDAVGGVIASYHETSSTGGASSCMNASNSPHLPNPPTLANLEEIADTIAAVQVGCLDVTPSYVLGSMWKGNEFFSLVYSFIFVLARLNLVLLSLLYDFVAYAAKGIFGDVHFAERLLLFEILAFPVSFCRSPRRLRLFGDPCSLCENYFAFERPLHY